MSNNLKKDKHSILLVGPGVMAREYIKVLNHLGHIFVVVGGGNLNVDIIKLKDRDVEIYGGGIDNFLGSKI